MPQATEPVRLVGWASIGAYVGRDARTAQRYERERGLPVRRMPGGGRSTVFALRDELDGWLLEDEARDLPETAPVPAPEAAPADTPPASALAISAPTPRKRRPVLLGAFAGVAVLSVLGAVGLRAVPARSGPSATVSTYDQQAAAALSQRSPAGLARAIDGYTQAVVRDPQDAAAYAGLANSYNLAPEVMGMAPSDAYARAAAAGERALALAPGSADAHRAIAFTAFWWGQDPKRADGEFRRALALDPQSALTHHWYATMLGALGDPRALAHIDRALSLAPSPALMIDKGWILAMLGREDEAAAVLAEAERLQPDSAVVHQHLALIARRRGDLPAELREERRAAELRRDGDELGVIAAGERALAAHGRPALLQTLADARRSLLAQGRGSAFLAAVAAADVRRRDDTLQQLASARAAHDPSMMSVRSSPDFEWLRGDPRFQALAP